MDTHIYTDPNDITYHLKHLNARTNTDSDPTRLTECDADSDDSSGTQTNADDTENGGERGEHLDASVAVLSPRK